MAVEAFLTEAGLRRLALWIIPLGYFLFVAGEFLAMTHIALDLTARGYSTVAVGAMASMMWVGIFSATFVAHAVVRRLGYARTLVLGNVLATVVIAAMAMQQAYLLWLPGAVLIGFAGGLVWVAGESWLAELAPAARRGFYVGLFESSVGIGMMCGPLMLVLAAAWGWPPLWLATLVLGVSLVASVLLLRRPVSAGRQADGHSASARPVVPGQDWRAVALPLAVIGAVSGLMESGSSAILPSIALRLDFSIAAAALLGTVIGAGSALMQTPMGALSDRIGMRRALLAAWAVLGLTNVCFLLFAPGYPALLWWQGFVLGGVGGAVYTLVVIELGHRLSGSALVRAMSLLVTTYSAGTMLGPLLGGSAFDLGGLRLLAAGLVFCSVVGGWLSLRQVRTD